jgi:uncharacterized YccA/Bax inhibitor family protein
VANPVLNQNRFDHAAETTTGPGWASTAGPSAEARGAGGGGSDTHGRFGAGEAASPATGKTMTVGGTLTATGVLFVLILISGAFGWSQVTPVPEVVDPSTGVVLQEAGADFPGWIFLPMIGGLILGLVTAFKPKIARFTAPLYALGYGVALGAISAMYETRFEGIVLQAVGATLSVVAVMLFLYATRIIKVTKRYVMVVVGATLGIFVMYMVGWIASIFGADIAFWNEPSALGIGISVVIVIVAALNLAIDFAFIETASKEGYPKYMEWYGAFGVTVTIVWLYLEILRLLALLRSN